MNKLISLLKQRWLISLLGILAIAALVWFAGPYIAIAGREPLTSPVVRLLVILLLVVLWGLNYLRKQLHAARAGNRLIEGLTDSATKTPADNLRMDERLTPGNRYIIGVAPPFKEENFLFEFLQ